MKVIKMPEKPKTTTSLIDNSDDQYLTAAEAAKALRVTRRTIYSYVKLGKLPNHPAAGAIRIPREAVFGKRTEDSHGS